MQRFVLGQLHFEHRIGERAIDRAPIARPQFVGVQHTQAGIGEPPPHERHVLTSCLQGLRGEIR